MKEMIVAALCALVFQVGCQKSASGPEPTDTAQTETSPSSARIGPAEPEEEPSEASDEPSRPAAEPSEPAHQAEEDYPDEGQEDEAAQDWGDEEDQGRYFD